MGSNFEKGDPTEWVNDSIAALKDEREWELDIEGGLRRLQQKDLQRKKRRRAGLWTALSLATAFVIVLSFPSTRAGAQFLLERLVLRGIQIVGVRPDLYSALAFEWTARPAPAHMVPGPDAAAAEAGFAPYLPDWTMISQPVPSFAIGVIGAGAGQFRIRVADLTTALRQAGVTNVGVPQSWDGAEIGIEFGPTVYVNARGFMLIQFLPGQISMPSGFPMAQFIEVLLRIGGMSEFQAQTLAARMGSNPGILLGIPSDSQLNVREVPLRAGQAVLIENTSGRPASPACAPCPGPQGLVLAWQTPNRVYVLKSDVLTEARAVEVANSLP